MAGDAEATSQSLTHPLPHPVPELARSEHLDVRHPGENPAPQFRATGGLQAELQRAVPALPQRVARVPPPTENCSFPRRFGAGLLLGTGLFVPGPPQNRATSRALPGRSPDASQPPLGVTPKLTESRQNTSVDTLGQVWQDRAAMNGSESQFFLTRAASSTSGRARTKFLSVEPLAGPGRLCSPNI